MSGNEHRQASDLIPPFFAQGAHKPLEYWGWGEEMRLGTASAELSRSRLIESHSQHIQAWPTNRQCMHLKKSSVPVGQCAEFNNTNRGGSYRSRTEAPLSSSIDPSTQLQISSGESVLSSCFKGGEHWSLKALSASTSCSTGGGSTSSTDCKLRWRSTKL